MLINLGLLNALVLGATILEPYFDLCLRQAQCLRQLKAATSRYVLVPMELHLEAQRLLRAERGALASLAAFFASPSGHCKQGTDNQMVKEYIIIHNNGLINKHAARTHDPGARAKLILH